MRKNENKIRCEKEFGRERERENESMKVNWNGMVGFSACKSASEIQLE